MANAAFQLVHPIPAVGDTASYNEAVQRGRRQSREHGGGSQADDAAISCVLIADDDPLIRSLVRATLAASNYRLLEAPNGNTALQLTQQHQPGAVVLDVRMPGLSGFEVAKAIREDPSLASTRIILLSADCNPKSMAVGLAAGADLYLAKPFSPLQLIKALENALGSF